MSKPQKTMKTLLLFILPLLVTITYGQTTFQKTYGGFGQIGTHIDFTSDGGFIISGTKGYNAPYMKFYLLKADSTGIIQWSKHFGGSMDEHNPCTQQTADNGFVVAGTTSSFGAGARDLGLFKTDSDGVLLWSKFFGGSGEEYGYSILQANDGGFVVCGETTSFGAGARDGYLVKTSSNGTVQWAKTFGGGDPDYFRSVRQTTDNGFIIVGTTYSFGSNQGVYLVKIDSTGALQWSKALGKSMVSLGFDLQQTNDGGFIITGVTNYLSGNDDVYVLKTASDGAVQWSNSYGGTANDWGYSVKESKDGGYIIAGTSWSSGFGSNDVLVLKISSGGSMQWASTFGGSGSDAGNSILQANDGGFIVAGSSRSFASGWEAYLIKTDIGGQSGCNEITPNIIVGNPATNAMVCSTQVFSGGITNLGSLQSSSGGSEVSLCSTVGINEEAPSGSFISISQNPFSSHTVLQTDDLLYNATLVVNNCFGQTVAQIKNISGQTIIFHRDNLPGGLYFVRLTEGSRVLGVEKLMILDK